MKTPIALLFLAASLASFSQAQRFPSTPQPTAQAQPASTGKVPCKPAPDQQRKQGWLEKKARTLACKQNRNMCDLPSSASEATGVTPQAKPCSENARPNPAPALKEQAQAPSVISPTPATAGGKDTYVCPPKTELIPNTPYCLTGEHTTVDAIALPKGLAAPAARNPSQNPNQQ